MKDDKLLEQIERSAKYVDDHWPQWRIDAIHSDHYHETVTQEECDRLEKANDSDD